MSLYTIAKPARFLITVAFAGMLSTAEYEHTHTSRADGNPALHSEGEGALPPQCP